MPKADGYECRMGGATSFDCTKANTIIERTICSNETLAEKDCLLGYVYKYSLHDALSAEHRKTITDDQRDWIKERNRFCEERPAAELTDCLTQLTNQRALGLIKIYGPQDDGVFSSGDFR